MKLFERMCEMSNRLRDVLEGKEANYILPFFWQHGVEEPVLREEMARIDEAGIGAVTVEARPHPDFLGPGWWRDIDIIMEEAKARGMRVWMLDDDHFPTGHAAGAIKDAPAELRRLFLTEKHIDAIGPRLHSSFMVSAVPYMPYFAEDGGGLLTSVVAIRRDTRTGELTDEAIDLWSKVDNGMLYWDVPEGCWRIYMTYETSRGGSKQHEDYLNPLVPESVRVLIDTVYEAFYERYSADFGNTFAGFFSDEPGFYNDKETFNFDSRPGKKNVPLPWSKEVRELLEQRLGAEYKLLLPLLWHDAGERSHLARYHYMDIVSSLYAKHFTKQIGDWCRERGVEYIGHVLEDNNVHARLGSGAGHFFRALGGQDMAGIDVVLWQLAPGFDELPYTWVAGETDSEFFNYGMAKMAASLAHLDPKKRGRTMAEVFGAYGWAEGLKLMKWLTDHMLVRGVNYYVPHAFSAKEFPDPDCPPHMYARGKNPQFRYYRYLNHYTNRMSHLLSDGVHIASAAVLYHAEAEWSGEAMLFHKPVKELLQHQIDCDVLPADALLDGTAKASGGKLTVNREIFDCLIIPYSEALPAALLERLTGWAEQGLPLRFIDSLPGRASEGGNVQGLLERLNACEAVETIRLKELGPALRGEGFFEITVEQFVPQLRYYHIRHEGLDVYMFFNEHPLRAVDTGVWLPQQGRLTLYDAYRNKAADASAVSDGTGSSFRLQLAPFEAVIVLAGAAAEQLETAAIPRAAGEGRVLSGPWAVELATSEQYPAFTKWKSLSELTDLGRQHLLPTFSGTFRYSAVFTLGDDADSGPLLLDLGEVYETAEVFVNGSSAGVLISYPYRLDIGELIRRGDNELVIEVTNTLVKAQPDFMSRVAQQEPSGLLGPVALYKA